MLVWSEPRPTRKARATDAMTKTVKHPLVLCTVARLFWQERKIEKAREWFDRAAKAASADEFDSGDIWAWWYKFEKEHGTKVKTWSISKLILILMRMAAGASEGSGGQVCSGGTKTWASLASSGKGSEKCSEKHERYPEIGYCNAVIFYSFDAYPSYFIVELILDVSFNALYNKLLGNSLKFYGRIIRLEEAECEFGNGPGF